MDFETNIGLPVFLDLRVVARNAAGDTAVSAVSNWNITDSSTVVLPGGADLINIHPEQIVARGEATVGAPDVKGTVTNNQFVTGAVEIRAPMIFELTDESTINLDPERVEADVPDELESVTLYAEMDNQFEFGADIRFLSARDTLLFQPGASGIPDTLATLTVPPNRSALDSIMLDREQFNLFTDSLYVKGQIMLLGRTDEQGNPLPTRMLSTDSLSVTLYAKVRFLNNPSAEEN